MILTSEFPIYTQSYIDYRVYSRYIPSRVLFHSQSKFDEGFVDPTDHKGMRNDLDGGRSFLPDQSSRQS